MNEIGTFSLILRLIIITMGLISLFLMFVSWKMRWNTWTEKTKDLWVALLMFIVGTTEGNIELLYRGVDFTAGAFFALAGLFLSIKGFRSKEGYTK